MQETLQTLALIIVGMLFGRLYAVPPTALHAFAILALALVAFNSAARARLRDIRKPSLLILLATIVLFTLVAHYAFDLSGWNSLLLSTLAISALADIRPFAIVLPFIALELSNSTPWSFIFTLLTGIGTGVFIGIILFALLKKMHHEIYAPLTALIAALSSYALAEQLGGMGVLAASTVGFFFANAYKEHLKLLKEEHLISKTVYLVTFILLGFLIMPSKTELVTSGLLFATYEIIIFAFKRKLSTLTEPHGIITATVVLFFAAYGLESMITHLAFTFILYSNALAFLVNWYENNTHRH